MLRQVVVGLLCLVAWAQPPQSVTLRGTVTDPSGAIVPGATVTLSTGSSTKANNDGIYTFTGLKPGDYTVQASAPGLALPKPIRVTLRPGAAPRTLAIQLQVATQMEQITVGETPTNGPTVSTEANENASSVVIKGKDLDALADDPNDLAADLQALAGPAAGPNGGAIFIDGFSGGEMPSKEAIREIRINQNPFSSEYDKLGFGRIEIFTKPGSDKFKGSIYYNFADDFWNSRNPYAAQKAPFRLYEYGGSLSGPVGRRASFFLDLRRDDIGNGAIINGATLDDATLAVIRPYTSTFLVPQKRLAITPRVDYQLSANHTLTARYSFTNTDISDSGIGAFNLASRGVHASNDSHVLQLTETAIIGTHAVNETRFQFFRVDTANLANDSSPSLQVIGAFSGGGSQFGHSTQLSNSYELQNNTSIMRGRHSVRFGIRLRGEALDSIAPVNFGGTFTFAGGPAPDSSTGVIDSLERYRRTLLFARLGYAPAQIRAAGGGASQFTLNAGDPLVNAGQTDAGLFIAEDWRVRPNLTISTGLRYETQTNIHDRRDFAPRFAMAWAPGRAGAKTKPKSVIRAGFGMFYDRFALTQTISALRYDGVRQRQFVITNPDFFPIIPTLNVLQSSASQQTIQRVSADLRAPYVMQSALSFERSLPFQTSVAATYANTHGLHMLRSQNINAPANPIFEVQSAGLYNQNQIITNVNTKVNKNVSLFGSYIWNRARSNTDGPGTFPSKPYSFAGEYGPASTDIHNRATLGGTLTAKWDIRLNPLFVLDSGPPFDITAGRDLYGSTLFNARPGFATDPAKPGLIATSYGLLDPNPSPGQPLVPRNFGRGPGSVVLNLRIGKTFSFGFGEGHEAPTNIPGGGMTRRSDAGVFSPTSSSGPAKTSRRYNITISMSIRNLLNHTNPGPIIGNITSPLFGQANQPAGSAVAIGSFSEAANNRRLELQTRFTF